MCLSHSHTHTLKLRYLSGLLEATLNGHICGRHTSSQGALLTPELVLYKNMY